MKSPKHVIIFRTLCQPSLLHRPIFAPMKVSNFTQIRSTANGKFWSKSNCVSTVFFHFPDTGNASTGFSLQWSVLTATILTERKDNVTRWKNEQKPCSAQLRGDLIQHQPKSSKVSKSRRNDQICYIWKVSINRKNNKIHTFRIQEIL